MPIVSPRASARFTPNAPEYGYERQPEEWLRLTARAANAALNGKMNCTGIVTLTPNSLTTTLTNRFIGPGSVIRLTPTKEAAGGEVGIWIVPGDGVATIHHANDSRSRTFRYAVMGV